jgi:hypothetical protein
VVGRNAKYPRENLVAHSNTAIRTNKIEKKQDLFVLRIQAVSLSTIDLANAKHHKSKNHGFRAVYGGDRPFLSRSEPMVVLTDPQ